MSARRPAPPLRRGPLVVLGDGILLFLALWGTVFSTVSAFSLQADRTILLGGCLLCTLVFLVSFSLPKLRWLPLLAVGGAWALAVWRGWELLVLGEISARCSVVNTFADQLGTGAYIQPIAQLPAATWTLAATAAVLAVLVPLACVMALSVVHLRSFWLLFWDSFPFVLLPLCITVTPDWLPLMALLLCWGTLLLSSLAGRYDRQGAARLNLFLLPALALVLALLTLLVPGQRPAWADRANERISAWAAETNRTLLPGPGGGAIASSDSTVDLSATGPLRYSGSTVLRVSTSLRGRLYLRGFSGAVYDGASWAPLPEEAYAGMDWNSAPDKGDLVSSRILPHLRGFQPLNFAALAQRASFPEKAYAQVTVENVAADPGYVYHPYQMLTTPEEVSGAEYVHDAYLARQENVWTHSVYVMPDCAPEDGAALTGEAMLAERAYRYFVEKSYLDVPQELQPQLTRLLRDAGIGNYVPYRSHTTDGYGSLWYTDDTAYRLEMAQAVADYLDELARYNPDTPATPEGEDFVSYFLCERREGYCMHFASAGALLLRTLGVPARYVTGYVANIPASGEADIPDSNAHAWVEIYLNGYGWEPVEVTPAYAGSHPGRSGASDPSATPTPRPTITPRPTQNPAATPTPTPKPATASHGGAGPDLRPLLPIAAVLLALALLALRRTLARRARTRRFTQGDPNRCAIAAYLYLRRLARWGGEIPPTAAELAQKAKFSQHTLTAAERDEVVCAALAQAAAADRALPPWRRFIFRYLAALY